MTTTMLALAVSLLAAGIVTGVFGLGIGLMASPLLAIFVHEHSPSAAVLSLALNAVTCIIATIVLAPQRLANWKHALGLGVITGAIAPFAAWADRAVPAFVTSYAFLGAMLFLVIHLLQPPRGHALPQVNWTVLYVGAAPAALVGGFTGIGPGFALMPGLVVAGMDVRHAAATAAAASILPSLTGLIPLWHTASAPGGLTGILFAAAIAGTAIGALFTARRAVELRWQRWFAGIVAVLTIAQFFTLR